MGELGTTLLVIPAGYETLSLKVYTIMHYGVGKLTSALSVILILVTLVPVIFVGFFFKRRTP
jgi:iron(III) transport system permease protein